MVSQVFRILGWGKFFARAVTVELVISFSDSQRTAVDSTEPWIMIQRFVPRKVFRSIKTLLPTGIAWAETILGLPR